MATTRARDYDDIAPAPPRTDAYTWILVISLLAMITGCILLYLDYSSYGDQSPPPPPAPVKALSGGEPEAPAGPAGGQPAPVPGQQQQQPGRGGPAAR